MDNAEKEAAWQDLLGAEYNVNYWTLLARHFHNRQRNAHIVLTAFTSSAVVGWWSGLAHTLNFSISSAASFCATVVLPLLKWADTSTQAQGERRAWEVILAEYETLWLKLNSLTAEEDPNATTKEIDRLRKKCAKQAGGKNILPRIAWLEKKARLQVCTYRGIPDTAPHDFWDRLFSRTA